MSDPTKGELLARIAELEKQSRGKKSGKLEFKVGEKGGVSIYGLGRFPVTLYFGQWNRLLDVAGDLRAFLNVTGYMPTYTRRPGRDTRLSPWKAARRSGPYLSVTVSAWC